MALTAGPDEAGASQPQLVPLVSIEPGEDWEDVSDLPGLTPIDVPGRMATEAFPNLPTGGGPEEEGADATVSSDFSRLSTRQTSHIDVTHYNTLSAEDQQAYRQSFKAKNSSYFSGKKEAVVRDILELENKLAEVDRRLEEERAKLGGPAKLDDATLLEAGRKKFNKEGSKHGIKFLINNGYFKEGGTAKEIAAFLHAEGTNGGCRKKPIGEYLGDFKPKNLEVLKEFASQHDFKGQNFDEALRVYLWSFYLPGEAQKIDRMMETFASRFCEQNEGLFKTTDGCFILSFATIMLNTSLYNPAAGRKTTCAEFQSMNRGIDDGSDLPDSLLIQTYESIASTSFKIPEDLEGLGYMFLNPDKKGFLLKEGGARKTWMNRYVVIMSGCLYYFKSQPTGQETPNGIVPLENLQVNAITEKRKGFKPNVFYFELTALSDSGDGQVGKIKGCKVDRRGKVVEGNHTKYTFGATTTKEMDEWIRCISQNVQKDNVFADVYQKKRSNAVGTSWSLMSM